MGIKNEERTERKRGGYSRNNPREKGFFSSAVGIRNCSVAGGHGLPLLPHANICLTT